MKTILKVEITASLADIENTVIADLSQVVCSKVDNLKDNEEHKLNIIVFGVEESASNLKNKRNENDTKVFIETFHDEVKTNIRSKDISKINRLGRKKEEGTTRPILISISSQDVNKEIIGNQHNQYVELAPSGFYVKSFTRQSRSHGSGIATVCISTLGSNITFIKKL